MIDPTLPSASAVSSSDSVAGGGKKNDVAGAARQFESLLLTQILRTAREAGGSEGWLGSGEDSASSSALEMAEEQFASALSAQGGLGLARMVTANLKDPARGG